MTALVCYQPIRSDKTKTQTFYAVQLMNNSLAFNSAIMSNLVKYSEDDLFSQKVIVHQLNCIARKPHGLSQEIASRFPYANVYGEREGSGNVAIPAWRDVPGEIAIRSEEDCPTVIGIFGQCIMGKSLHDNPFSQRLIAAPGSLRKLALQDTRGRRLGFFEKGLRKIAEKFPEVHMPEMIGCSLAGGDHAKYLAVMHKVAQDTRLEIVLHRKLNKKIDVKKFIGEKNAQLLAPEIAKQELVKKDYSWHSKPVRKNVGLEEKKEFVKLTCPLDEIDKVKIRRHRTVYRFRDRIAEAYHARMCGVFSDIARGFKTDIPEPPECREKRACEILHRHALLALIRARSRLRRNKVVESEIKSFDHYLSAGMKKSGEDVLNVFRQTCGGFMTRAQLDEKIKHETEAKLKKLTSLYREKSKTQYQVGCRRPHNAVEVMRHFERFRYETYRHFGGSVQLAYELSENGFMNFPDPDSKTLDTKIPPSVCVYCKCLYVYLEESEDVAETHKKLSPNCPFVTHQALSFDDNLYSFYLSHLNLHGKAIFTPNDYMSALNNSLITHEDSSVSFRGPPITEKIRNSVIFDGVVQRLIKNVFDDERGMANAALMWHLNSYGHLPLTDTELVDLISDFISIRTRKPDSEYQFGLDSLFPSTTASVQNASKALTDAAASATSLIAALEQKVKSADKVKIGISLINNVTNMYMHEFSRTSIYSGLINLAIASEITYYAISSLLKGAMSLIYRGVSYQSEDLWMKVTNFFKGVYSQAAAKFVGIIMSIITSITFTSKIPTLKDIGDFLAWFGRVNMGIRGAREVFGMIMDWVKDKYYYYMYGMTHAQHRLNSLLPNFAKWMKNQALVRKFTPIYMTTSTMACELIDKVYDQGEKYLAYMRANPTYSASMYQTITRMQTEVRKLWLESQSSAARRKIVRPEPYGLWLYGAPGVGKTEMLRILSMDVLKQVHKNDKRNTYDLNVYSRKSGEDFWSGYNGQLITKFDDAGQKVDSVGSPDETWIEIIRTINGDEYSLPMADLESKGNTVFSSQHVWATSNIKVPTPKSIADAGAIYRRMKWYEVTVDDSFATADGKLDKRKIPMIDGVRDPFCKDIYSIQQYNPADNTKVGGPMSYDMFVRNYVNKFLDHTIEQNKKIEVLSNYQNGESEELFVDCGALDSIDSIFDASEDEIEDQLKEMLSDEAVKRAVCVRAETTSVLSDEYLCDVVEVPQEKIERPDVATLADAMRAAVGKILPSKKLMKEHPLAFVFMSLITIVGGLFIVNKIRTRCIRTCKNEGEFIDALKSKCTCDTCAKLQAAVAGGVTLDQDGVGTLARMLLLDVGLESELGCMLAKVIVSQTMMSGDPTTKIVPKKYKASAYNASVSEFSKNTEEVAGYLLQKNLVRITDGDTNTGMLLLQGHCALVNAHAWNFMKLGNILMYNPLNSKPVAIFCGEHLKTTSVKADGHSDLLVVQLPKTLPQAPSIVKHIVKRSQFDQCIKNRAVRVGTLFNNNSNVPYVTRDEINSVRVVASHVVENDIFVNMISYDIMSEKGNCGSVVLTHGRTSGKIFAMHAAGDPAICRGYAQPFCYEDIVRCVEEFETVKLANPVIGGENEIVNDHGVAYQSVGVKENISFVGETKPVYAPSKTEVSSSLIHDLFEKRTAPALLRKTGGIDPYEGGIDKFTKQSCMIPEEILDVAANDVKRQYVTGDVTRVLNMYESFHGADDLPLLNPMERATSPGYPYILYSTRPGKTQWLGVGEERIVEESARQEYERIENKLKNGLRPNTICLGQLKDERRPLKNGVVKRTRMFIILNFVLNAVIRSRFGAFINYFLGNRLLTESSVGINVYSHEWHVLYRKVIQFGENNILAADYSDFDGTQSFAVASRVADIINCWYDDDYSQERMLLIEEIYNPNVMIDGVVYSFYGVNTSGNPMTVILNTIVGMIYMRSVYLALNPNGLICDFTRYVVLQQFGDDSIIGVSSEIDWFNFEAIQNKFLEFGIKITEETKSEESVGLRSIKDVSYLKRSFKKEEDRLCVAPLSKDVIEEMVLWVRKSWTRGEKEVATLENVKNAVFEASLHGKEYYSKFSKCIEQALRKEQVEYIAPCYVEQRADLYKRGSLASMFESQYQSGRPVKYCCDLKCFKMPWFEFDGMCGKCKCYNVCHCCCVTHMSSVQFCCENKCLVISSYRRLKKNGLACYVCRSIDQCRCECIKTQQWFEGKVADVRSWSAGGFDGEFLDGESCPNFENLESMIGDGNCVPRALSRIKYGVQDHWMHIRRMAVLYARLFDIGTPEEKEQLATPGEYTGDLMVMCYCSAARISVEVIYDFGDKYPLANRYRTHTYGVGEVVGRIVIHKMHAYVDQNLCDVIVEGEEPVEFEDIRLEEEEENEKKKMQIEKHAEQIRDVLAKAKDEEVLAALDEGKEEDIGKDGLSFYKFLKEAFSGNCTFDEIKHHFSKKYKEIYELLRLGQIKKVVLIMCHYAKLILSSIHLGQFLYYMKTDSKFAAIAFFAFAEEAFKRWAYNTASMEARLPWLKVAQSVIHMLLCVCCYYDPRVMMAFVPCAVVGYVIHAYDYFICGNKTEGANLSRTLVFGLTEFVMYIGMAIKFNLITQKFVMARVMVVIYHLVLSEMDPIEGTVFHSIWNYDQFHPFGTVSSMLLKLRLFLEPKPVGEAFKLFWGEIKAIFKAFLTFVNKLRGVCDPIAIARGLWRCVVAALLAIRRRLGGRQPLLEEQADSSTVGWCAGGVVTCTAKQTNSKSSGKAQSGKMTGNTASASKPRSTKKRPVVNKKNGGSNFAVGLEKSIKPGFKESRIEDSHKFQLSEIIGRPHMYTSFGITADQIMTPNEDVKFAVVDPNAIFDEPSVKTKLKGFRYIQADVAFTFKNNPSGLAAGSYFIGVYPEMPTINSNMLDRKMHCPGVFDLIHKIVDINEPEVMITIPFMSMYDAYDLTKTSPIPHRLIVAFITKPVGASDPTGVSTFNILLTGQLVNCSPFVPIDNYDVAAVEEEKAPLEKEESEEEEEEESEESDEEESESEEEEESEESVEASDTEYQSGTRNPSQIRPSGKMSEVTALTDVKTATSMPCVLEDASSNEWLIEKGILNVVNLKGLDAAITEIPIKVVDFKDLMEPNLRMCKTQILYCMAQKFRANFRVKFVFRAVKSMHTFVNAVFSPKKITAAKMNRNIINKLRSEVLEINAANDLAEVPNELSIDCPWIHPTPFKQSYEQIQGRTEFGEEFYIPSVPEDAVIGYVYLLQMVPIMDPLNIGNIPYEVYMNVSNLKTIDFAAALTPVQPSKRKAANKYTFNIASDSKTESSQWALETGGGTCTNWCFQGYIGDNSKVDLYIASTKLETLISSDGGIVTSNYHSTTGNGIMYIRVTGIVFGKVILQHMGQPLKSAQSLPDGVKYTLTQVLGQEVKFGPEIKGPLISTVVDGSSIVGSLPAIEGTWRLNLPFTVVNNGFGVVNYESRTIELSSLSYGPVSGNVPRTASLRILQDKPEDSEYQSGRGRGRGGRGRSRGGSSDGIITKGELLSDACRSFYKIKTFINTGLDDHVIGPNTSMLVRTETDSKHGYKVEASPYEIYRSLGTYYSGSVRVRVWLGSKASGYNTSAEFTRTNLVKAGSPGSNFVDGLPISGIRRGIERVDGINGPSFQEEMPYIAESRRQVNYSYSSVATKQTVTRASIAQGTLFVASGRDFRVMIPTVPPTMRMASQYQCGRNVSQIALGMILTVATLVISGPQETFLSGWQYDKFLNDFSGLTLEIGDNDVIIDTDLSDIETKLSNIRDYTYSIKSNVDELESGQDKILTLNKAIEASVGAVDVSTSAMNAQVLLIWGQLKNVLTRMTVANDLLTNILEATETAKATFGTRAREALVGHTIISESTLEVGGQCDIIPEECSLSGEVEAIVESVV